MLHPFAIGGVINMITKKGKKTDDPKPDVSFKGGYGRYDFRFGKNFSIVGAGQAVPIMPGFNPALLKMPSRRYVAGPAVSE